MKYLLILALIITTKIGYSQIPCEGCRVTATVVSKYYDFWHTDAGYSSYVVAVFVIGESNLVRLMIPRDSWIEYSIGDSLVIYRRDKWDGARVYYTENGHFKVCSQNRRGDLTQI